MTSDKEIFFDVLEQDYREKLPYWRELENEVLESFSEDELKDFIKNINGTLTLLQKYYKRDLSREKQKHKNLSEIAEYFIEQFFYTFLDGKEIERGFCTLGILKLYYSRKFKKYITRKVGKYKKAINIGDIPIERVIGKYMRLDRGFKRNYLCPIHKEKTPSFRIHPVTNSYFCYGCHSGGNAINFIADIEGIGTKEAWRRFQEYFNF